MIINFKYIISHSKCFIDRSKFVFIILNFLENRIFQAESCNTSFSNYVILSDKGRYIPDPNNPDQTLKILDVEVDVKAIPIPGLHHKVNEIVLSKYFEGLLDSDKSDVRFIERRIMQGVENETSPERQAKSGNSSVYIYKYNILTSHYILVNIHFSEKMMIMR